MLYLSPITLEHFGNLPCSSIILLGILNHFHFIQKSDKTQRILLCSRSRGSFFTATSDTVVEGSATARFCVRDFEITRFQTQISRFLLQFIIMVDFTLDFRISATISCDC